MKKEMLINVLQPEECRIAIVEDGVLEELYVERTSQESYVGNIYKGRIVNIEPSIQAAFVDFGVGRNGFLHVSDVDPAYYKHLLSKEAWRNTRRNWNANRPGTRPRRARSRPWRSWRARRPRRSGSRRSWAAPRTANARTAAARRPGSTRSRCRLGRHRSEDNAPDDFAFGIDDRTALGRSDRGVRRVRR